MQQLLRSQIALIATTVGCCGTVVLPQQAHAFGFTLPFGDWALTNYENFNPGTPFNAAPIGTSTSSSVLTPYTCADFVDSVACISDFDAPNGIATIVGSNFDPDVDPSLPSGSNGIANQPWATQWEMTTAYAGASPFNLSFDWTFVPGDIGSDDQSYYYTIDASNTLTTYILSSSLASGTETVTLETDWKIGFGVYTLSNAGGPGKLGISQFGTVPAPLPLFGAAAAFGWSRRLRMRLHAASQGRRG